MKAKLYFMFLGIRIIKISSFISCDKLISKLYLLPSDILAIGSTQVEF